MYRELNFHPNANLQDDAPILVHYGNVYASSMGQFGFEAASIVGKGPSATKEAMESLI